MEKLFLVGAIGLLTSAVMFSSSLYAHDNEIHIGQHGGNVYIVGPYHVEAVVNKGKEEVDLFVLGAKALEDMPIDSQQIWAKAYDKMGGKERKVLHFKAVRNEGSETDSTAHFRATWDPVKKLDDFMLFLKPSIKGKMYSEFTKIAVNSKLKPHQQAEGHRLSKETKLAREKE